jgi:hypothetical protein
MLHYVGSCPTCKSPRLPSCIVPVQVQQEVDGEHWFLQHTIDVGPVAVHTDVFVPLDDFVLACSSCGTASLSSMDWTKVRFFAVNATGEPFHASVVSSRRRP